VIANWKIEIEKVEEFSLSNQEKTSNTLQIRDEEYFESNFSSLSEDLLSPSSFFSHPTFSYHLLADIGSINDHHETKQDNSPIIYYDVHNPPTFLDSSSLDSTISFQLTSSPHKDLSIFQTFPTFKQFSKIMYSLPLLIPTPPIIYSDHKIVYKLHYSLINNVPI